MFELNDKKSKFYAKLIVAIIHLLMVGGVIKFFINFELLFEMRAPFNFYYYFFTESLTILTSIGISSHYIVKYYGGDVDKRRGLISRFFLNWLGWILLVITITSIPLMFLFSGVLTILALSLDQPQYLIIYLLPIIIPFIVICGSLRFFDAFKKFVIFNLSVVLLLYVAAFLAHIFSPIYPCHAGSSSCLSNLAIKKKNPNLCEYELRELGANPNINRNYCYIKLYSLSDDSICQFIDDPERMNECQCEMSGICK
jgi:hypothetical protein